MKNHKLVIQEEDQGVQVENPSQQLVSATKRMQAENLTEMLLCLGLPPLNYLSLIPIFSRI